MMLSFSTCFLVAAFAVAATADGITPMPCRGQITDSQCVNFSVPLDHGNPDAEKIYTYATLFRSGGNPDDFGSADGILWNLDFGCSGWDLNAAFNWMQDLSQTNNFIIVTPNMRGDGLSYPRFACTHDPDGIEDPPSVDCAREFSNNKTFLSHFNLDNAAQDVYQLMQAINSGKPNYLFSTRHGSLWAQRVLANYPGKFVRSIMAGYTNPMAYDFFASMIGRESATRRLLHACSRDVKCSTQLGGGADVEATFSRVLQLADMDLLPCNQHLSQFAPQHNESWRHVYGSMIAELMAPTSLFLEPKSATVAFGLPVLYRLQRCDPSADVPVLTKVFNTIKAKVPSPTRSPSGCQPSSILRANILLNEVVRNDPTETVEFINQASTMASDIEYAQGWLAFYNAFPIWRKPSGNANDAQKWYPKNSGDAKGVAKFAGTLDSALPYTLAQTSTLWDTSSTTQYVVLENNEGFMLKRIRSKPACVVRSMQSYFIKNDTLAKLDECVNQSQTLDLFGTDSSTQSARQQYFGNVDVWSYTRPTSGTYIIPGVPFTTLPPFTTEPANTTMPPPNTSQPGPAPPKHHSDAGAIVGGIFGALAALAFIVVIYWKCCRSGGGGGGSAFGTSSGAHVQYGAGGGGGWQGGSGGGGLYNSY